MITDWLELRKKKLDTESEADFFMRMRIEHNDLMYWLWKHRNKVIDMPHVVAFDVGVEFFGEEIADEEFYVTEDFFSEKVNIQEKKIDDMRWYIVPERVPEGSDYFNGYSLDGPVGGLLHRIDGPAEIVYYDNGNIRNSTWYFKGDEHRGGGLPSHTAYYKGGEKDTEWWYEDGVRHRIDGPSYISYDIQGNIVEEQWTVDGQRHRENGPASIEYGSKGEVLESEWFIDGIELTKHEFIIRNRKKKLKGL